MNRVVVENQRPGDGDWWASHAPGRTIEGYASWPSVRPGERLELHVSTTPAARYFVTVHRLGWYDGDGGRTCARHPPRGDVVGLAREVPELADGPSVPSAGWPVTDSILIGDDWCSGQYVARLVLADGPHAGRSAFVPFVVRERPGDRAACLVQMPVTTAAAYNHWGGKSLYASNSTDRVPAVKVTFDRPIPTWHEANLNARWPFIWDVQLVRFLEREGYDVAYTTDVDTHREPWSLHGRTLLMTSGHDEYWTAEMRDAFEDAVAVGTNLACMGANTAYWQCRFEDGDRTMVEYRFRDTDPVRDPASQSIKFRDLVPPRPEALLLGVAYQEGMKRSQDPARSYTVAAPADDPWLLDTGLAPGVELPDRVGYEWDALVPGLEPDGVTVLFHHDDPVLSHADCVRWRHASGALIFAAGTLQLTWALDAWAHPGHTDPRLQQFMRNALADLLPA